MRINIKKIMSLLLVLAMVICCSQAAMATGESLGATSAGDFEYTVTSPAGGSTYATLVKYTGTQSKVTIPSSFGGAPLKVIGHEAFCEKDITSVTIPNGVEIIDSRAFCACKKLDNVVLPNTVREIGDFAFSGCYYEKKTVDLVSGTVTVISKTGLTHIILPSSLERIGDAAFAGCEIFEGNSTVPSKIPGNPAEPSLVLPSSVKEIGAGAFAQCRSLVNVIIPEGVTDIKTETFTDCSSLKKVDIPSTVTHIGVAFNGAFAGRSSDIGDYEPELWIRAPHCIIEHSPNMYETAIVYGARHSSVQAYVDKVNKDREDASLFNEVGELVELTPEIHRLSFVAIEVPGHTFYGVETVPTCTERGYTTYRCQQCLEAGYYTSPGAPLYIAHECEYTIPLGHMYGDWSDGTAPGCTTVGSKYRICERELTDTHGTILTDKDGIALTCGYISYVQVPAKGHSFEKKSSVTCTKDGSVWKECKDCHTKTDIQPVSALGHLYDYDNPAEIVKLVECDGSGNGTDGVYIYSCKNGCGETKRGVVSAHPDTDEDKKCDKCGKALGSTDLSPDHNCSCFCHSEKGIKALFYKFQLFFWKLFKVEKSCACGAMHY